MGDQDSDQYPDPLADLAPPNFDSMATALINAIVGLILSFFFTLMASFYTLFMFSFFYRSKDLWSIDIETNY